MSSYAVCCYTCEHNMQETCRGCNTNLDGVEEPYENWELRQDLQEKDKKIDTLQHENKVLKRALKKYFTTGVGFIKGLYDEAIQQAEKEVTKNEIL